MAGKKLLVADDSLTIQKVIRLALSNEGYEIQAVSDGNDAVQQISLFRPDAILIDVSLPGKSAFEVKRAVNEHSDLEEIRFILMSSAFEKVDEAQAEEVRFHGRLTKPFDPAHLRQVLTDTLAQVATKRREPTSWLEPPESTEEKDWMKPVQPDDLIVAPPPPMVPSEMDDEEGPEADIKHLTESTIRMSGLDDYEWSVNEPSIKPSSHLLDDGDSSFKVEPPELDSISLGALPDPLVEKQYAASPSDFYRKTDAAPPLPRPAMHEANLAGISSDEIEEILRKELRKELQKLLPDLAEKIIKQEIHRMLSESPT